MDIHPWVILSSMIGDHVLVANFTKWLEWKDQTCIVDPSECPTGILTLRSCVEYAGCDVVKLGTLESKVDDGQFNVLGTWGQMF